MKTFSEILDRKIEISNRMRKIEIIFEKSNERFKYYDTDIKREYAQLEKEFYELNLAV